MNRLNKTKEEKFPNLREEREERDRLEREDGKQKLREQVKHYFMINWYVQCIVILMNTAVFFSILFILEIQEVSHNILLSSQIRDRGKKKKRKEEKKKLQWGNFFPLTTMAKIWSFLHNWLQVWIESWTASHCVLLVIKTPLFPSRSLNSYHQNYMYQGGGE